MREEQRDVVVVGGGISGLPVAWHLHNAAVDVCLLEAGGAVGGCTRSESRDGFLLEKGPFNVIVRDPAFEALLEGVASEVTVVTASPAARRRYIYRRGRLFTVPTNPISLATTGLLSIGGKWGLMAGLLASRRGGEAEETIEQVAIRRFGKNVSDTLISAVIAGIFAGDIRKLSLQACFPFVAEIDQRARSLIAYGLVKALGSKGGKKGRKKRRWRGLVSIDGGLGTLTETLGRALGPNLMTDCRAETVREVDDGYEVSYGNGGDATGTIRCRRLVIALPTAEAARLLQPLIPDAAGIIKTIESSSLVVVNLGFRRLDVGHPMEGYGFLVPHDETGFPLMGVLFADSIFPHHAPSDSRLIRVFIGGASNHQAVEWSDEDLLKTAMGSLRDLFQVSGDPVLIDICRYPSAIPQYHVGHVEKIAGLRAAIATKPGLHLVGNYLEGVSLNDCVRVAVDLASEIITETAPRQSLAAVCEEGAVGSATV